MSSSADISYALLAIFILIVLNKFLGVLLRKLRFMVITYNIVSSRRLLSELFNISIEEAMQYSGVELMQHAENNNIKISSLRLAYLNFRVSFYNVIAFCLKYCSLVVCSAGFVLVIIAYSS